MPLANAEDDTAKVSSSVTKSRNSNEYYMAVSVNAQDNVTTETYLLIFNSADTSADYSIISDTSKVSFPDAFKGYSDITCESAEIKNTGNSAVIVSIPQSKYFDLTVKDDKSLLLNAGESLVINIKPKPALESKAYSEDIIVTTDKNTSATINVSFTVKDPPVYSISSDKSQISFENASTGYALIDWESVKITNLGNTNTVIGIPQSKYFDVVVNNHNSRILAPGESLVITIKPKQGLSSGEYSEDIVVTTDKAASVTINAVFSV